MFRVIASNTKFIIRTSVAVLLILFSLNIIFYMTAIAQVSPGEGDGENTCYDNYAICDEGEDCEFSIICDLHSSQCPDWRAEVENGIDPSTCQ